jgi:hypothetical protein
MGDDRRGKQQQEGMNGDRGEGQRKGGGNGRVRKGVWRTMKDTIEELAQGP